MIVILLITIVALVAFLLLPDTYPRWREVARMTYFAGALGLLLQYGSYFESLIKR